MSHETNDDYAAPTAAVVELTFSGGIARRYELDVQDCPIYLDLFADTDLRETTADDAALRTFAQGARRKVKLLLEGRGPQPSATVRCTSESLSRTGTVRCTSTAGHPNLTTGSHTFNHGDPKSGLFWNDAAAVDQPVSSSVASNPTEGDRDE